MSDVLNLGAGNDIRDGAVNHDRVPHRCEISIVHDLNVLPWPWADNTFELILARAVLEHLQINLIQSVNECWRVLKPGGILYLKLPYWRHEHAWQDPTHYWQFTLHTCDVFDPDTEYGKAYSFYTDRKWKITKPAKLNAGKSSFYVTMQVRK